MNTNNSRIETEKQSAINLAENGEVMRIKFLGGAEEVGSLGLLLETNGVRLLCDYGLSPTRPPKYPSRVQGVDLILLSHAHVDHSGMIPWICSRQNTEVLATTLTQKVAELLAYDSLKVVEAEGFPIPYYIEDIKSAKRNYINVEYGESRYLDSLEIIPHSAGHIPGSTMYEIRGEESILFSGDINTIHTNLVFGCKGVKCDTLFLESTYAGREHPDRRKLENEFLDKIKEVKDNGGVSIIPAFAVGRTQEIMLILEKLDYEIWLDGMGRSVNTIFLNFPKYLRSPKKLKRARNKIKVVRSNKHRRQALKGDIILTTSGMLDGGPVLYYIDALRSDEKNAILLTGYQVDGTNGRMLLEESAIDFHGVTERVNCQVEFFDFSAHAGHKELKRFVKECDPENVVLFHGEHRDALVDDLENYNVILPKAGENIEI